MMISFRPQFAPYVREGSKRHTLRAPRRDGKLPLVNEPLHCFTGARTKQCELLGRWPCMRVETAYMEWSGSSLAIALGGIDLFEDEAERFAWRDGFRAPGTTEDRPGPALELLLRCWLEMGRFSESREWSGYLYEWNFEHPVGPPSPRRKRR